MVLAMHQFAIRRFVALGLWVVAALYSGARLMLDMIGYTTAPEDFEQLRAKLPGWLDWLFSTPWEVPAVLMIALTAFVIWLSWPRRTVQTVTRAEAARRGLPLPPAEDINEGPTRIRLQFGSGDNPPEFLDGSNIYRYYALAMGVVGVYEDGQRTVAKITALVLLYEHPISHGNVRVRFAGSSQAQQYEVKDFGPRHAIITLSGVVKDVIVEVETY